MVKHGTVRIEGGDFLHDQELQVAQRCFAEIHDVHLHTLQQLAFAYTIERLQVHRSEDDPRYVQTVQVSGQLFRFHPWCGKHLERNGIPHTNGHISQLSQNAADGVEECRMRMWNVWRGGNPLQSGLGIIHLAFPAFHLHYVEITLFPILQHLLAIEHQCQLTASEGVKVRNFKLAYKRNAIIFNQVAFNLQSAYGIGPVQHNEFLAVFGSGFHGQSHGADVGKGTTTDVLDVIYQYIYVFQHVRCGLAGLSVK